MDNNKILYRIEIIEKCINGKITENKASKLLNISIRQIQRLIKKYKENGKISLFHGLTNKESNHSINKDIKNEVLELIKTKYYDFGATLLNECLDRYENIKVNRETLRLWLKENKLRCKIRRRKPYRQKRERKLHFGEMLQIDGTFHKWFITDEIKFDNENNRKACLINLIDDATNVNELLFDKQETMNCACLVLWNWIKKYGIPYSIYCDKRNMYVSNKYYEELNNDKGLFRQMCNNLNIRVITANSPQAKGRVERSNQTHQDRLTKLMRLRNIKTIEEANNYLLDEYIKEHNKKFAINIKNTKKYTNINNNINDIIDIHTKISKSIKLDDICYTEEIRKLNNDWTISYKNEWYQLKKQSKYNPPCKSTVFVRKTINGVIKIFYRNNEIEYNKIS